ncbi:hypothetical protein ACQ4PT_044667 [Festuca glaucescens]
MSVSADCPRLWEEGRASNRVRSYSSPTSGTAAKRLTDDLLVEILSRVPAKSLRRFRCVSKHWLSLTDDRHHRRKLPQTLAGFFCTSTYEYGIPKSCLRFVSASGSRCPLIHPYLSFLPDHLPVDVLDCCNGLLLCRCFDVSGGEFRYIVCNPATERWTVLADRNHAGKVVIARLGFDPAMSSHFSVFLLLKDMEFNMTNNAVDVYSSKTGRWVHKEKGWAETIVYFVHGAAPVFLNGCLHFYAYGNKSNMCIGAVNMKGGTWTTFGIPYNQYFGFVQQSQGCLHYASFQIEDGVVVRLVVYVLEDYDSKEWVLKHSVETSYIFGVTNVTDSQQFARHQVDPRWMAIHPQCNLIFFATGHASTLMCYNMDSLEAKVICSLDCHLPRFPYVPLYAELPSLHK